jgi:hypothetical protein
MLGRPINIQALVNDSQFSYQQSLFGWFVQDDVRLSRNITLNLGLRHEFTSTVDEPYGRLANLLDIQDSQPTLGILFKPRKDNFAPRVGLAWDVFGNGRTAVRLGAGVFHEQLVPSTQRFGFARTFPFSQLFTVTNPSSLTIDLNSLPPAGIFNIETWELNPHLPTRYQWNLSLQQEMWSGTTVSAAYVGARSVHLQLRNAINHNVPEILEDGRKFFPATGRTRKNPIWGPSAQMQWRADSDYHGLQLGVNRRFAQGLQYQASYTYSRSVDIASSAWAGALALNAGFIQDPDDIERERALSSHDLRHLFTSNITYDLPFGAGMGGVAGQLIKGWQLNGLISLNSGLPFNITNGFERSRNGEPGGTGDRPNLAPGANNNPTEGVSIGCPGVPAGQKLGTPDLYFDPCAFELQEAGTYGNLGRNTVIGPGLANFDLSVTKRFQVDEHRNVQFRAEFFNVLNHPNFSNFVRTVFTGTGARNGSAGRITSTSTTSRQIQFGLKLSF